MTDWGCILLGNGVKVRNRGVGGTKWQRFHRLRVQVVGTVVATKRGQERSEERNVVKLGHILERGGGWR